MADPSADLIGDYRAVTALQRDRLAARGIDFAPYELSHLAVRVPEWDQYVHLRTLLERHAAANRENVWNGRPISLIVPAEPLEVLDGKVVPLIELIPPIHQRVYKMGLEHLGVTNAASKTSRCALTGAKTGPCNAAPTSRSITVPSESVKRSQNPSSGSTAATSSMDRCYSSGLISSSG